ncbi:Triacylglycerol lipase [Bertholletia excelsa]
MAPNFPLVTFNLFSLLVVGFNFVGAQKVPAMYVLGDSLVDVGNNNYLVLSRYKADFPNNGVDYAGHKPTGRFSNGKNAADFLGKLIPKVGLASPPPYLSFVFDKSNGGFPTTGVSFASGGAGIFSSTDKLFKQAISLTKQVEYYSIVQKDLVKKIGSAAAQDHISKSIFAIVIGSNDILGYYQSGSDLPVKYTPQQYVDSMVLTLKDALKKMHDFGARKYVIAGLPPVGCCPSQRNRNASGGCYEEENYLSAKYNDGLRSMLRGLKSELNGFAYTYLDLYSVFTRFIQSPSTYGFTEIKAACCGFGNLKAQVPCVPVATYCPNRHDHLFWDFYHPTEAAAHIVVNTLFNGSIAM